MSQYLGQLERLLWHLGRVFNEEDNFKGRLKIVSIARLDNLNSCFNLIKYVYNEKVSKGRVDDEFGSSKFVGQLHVELQLIIKNGKVD